MLVSALVTKASWSSPWNSALLIALWVLRRTATIPLGVDVVRSVGSTVTRAGFIHSFCFSDDMMSFLVSAGFLGRIPRYA